ncbi:c-type cytochrome [Thalassobaculum sp.]|uniref:c-type cytochrome n=1 Tax=Thalassobaculum sp. TaxID=2022740 RepID=UPI003B5915D0
MTRPGTFLTGTVLVALIGLLAPAPAASQDANTWSTVKRGLYLTRVGDCEACHTVAGQPAYAGNRALPTPFGTIYSANLTPDPDTGIGDWDSDTFFRALDEGVGKDGKRLYPAFPYTHFTYVTREDSDAIFAYLQSLDPVRNEIREPDLPPLIGMRTSMRAWNLLNFEEKDFAPDPEKSPQWNRGRYLVEGLGHCSACHSPRNLTGAEKRGGARYTGGMAEGWFAPSLRSTGPDGIGDWSAEDLKTFLKHGRNDRTAAFGPMAEVIDKSTRWMTDADISAVVAYLRDLPVEAEDDAERAEGERPDDTVMALGGEIYASQCAACHGPDGEGVTGMFATLAGSSLVHARNPTTLIRLVLDGAKAVPTERYPTPFAMPPFHWKLSDAEVAATLSYVRNAFGNSAGPVTEEAVADLRGAH